MRIKSHYKSYLEAGAILTPYATAFRYPNEFFELEPDETQVYEAIQLSAEILEFVLKILPEVVRPE